MHCTNKAEGNHLTDTASLRCELIAELPSSIAELKWPARLGKPGLFGYLVCVVHLVNFMQPNKPDRPTRPNEQAGLAPFFSILLERRTGRPPIGGRPVRLPDYRSDQGLTLMRSLIISKVSLGITFLATNSPFSRYGRFVTMRSARSLERPSTSTISPADALLIFIEEEMD